MTATGRRSRFVTVEVDVADYLDNAAHAELSELGLHREDDCAPDPDETAAELYTAINALHQQAHADQPIHADACLREPCRSLPLRQHPGLSASPGPF